MIFRRIYRLLLPEERKTSVRVVLTVLCSAVLDFMGLAALLPVLYYLLDDGNNSHAALSFCILAISVILLKSVLSLFFSRYQHRYLLSFYKRLSFSLYSSYYRKGLLFIREQGSNKLGYEVNAICYAFSQSLLAPMLKMVGDCLLVFLVTVALLIYDGTTVLLLYAAFLPFMLLYFFCIRTRIKKYGKLELDANRLKIDMVQKFPLFLSELSVIIGLTLLVVFSTGDVKMLIGVFAVAAFRLLSAMRGILSGWTQIQNVSTCLDTIEDGLDAVLGEAGGKLSGGQKQRIGIARALYKEADVLFLDEATSSLDNQTEKEVNDTLMQLKEIYKGLTILSIAHRESSLAYCDRIITLEDKE